MTYVEPSKRPMERYTRILMEDLENVLALFSQVPVRGSEFRVAYAFERKGEVTYAPMLTKSSYRYDDKLEVHFVFTLEPGSELHKEMHQLAIREQELQDDAAIQEQISELENKQRQLEDELASLKEAKEALKKG